MAPPYQVLTKHLVQRHINIAIDEGRDDEVPTCFSIGYTLGTPNHTIISISNNIRYGNRQIVIVSNGY